MGRFCRLVVAFVLAVFVGPVLLEKGTKARAIRGYSSIIYSEGSEDLYIGDGALGFMNYLDLVLG